MTTGHGGNLRELAERAGCRPQELLDFSANINPLGPPESLRAIISRNLETILHYPDPHSTEFVQAAAVAYGCPAERIVAGNGSSEILFALMRAIDRPRAVIPVPCYIDYLAAARQSGKAVETILLSEQNGFTIDFSALAKRLAGDEVVLIGRPNNPTGVGFEAGAFRQFAAEHPETIFVVDEAFMDFDDQAESLVADAPPNTVVLRSLTKFYAIAGLRLGLAVAPPDLAEAIRNLLTPWSVNSLAQAVGVAVFAEADYAHRTRQAVRENREQLTASLRDIGGLTVFDGEANYLLVKLDATQPSAPQLAEKILAKRIAIRVCDNYEGLGERFFRVAVRTAEENQRLVETLQSVLVGKAPVARKRRTPAIMFQGTSSNAGKSVLAAAMCRILMQDGVRVAPFKSQNMSLNSFVTHDGCEMGRAQVTQAQACRLEPDVRMNPILLKPNSDTGSQVIVRGRAVANMRVGEYIRYKPEAFVAARECYDSLSDQYDAIVLEGAGSPGEVNLKHHDIVNMTMARHAASPVLLVGDIDRGGVFASFVGTMEVLAEWERQMVAGFVINRFRGDASLLASAVEFTMRYTGKDTFGVVPYLPNLGLPEEDSVEFKSGALDASATDQPGVEVAVIDLPHISNFTDIDALRIEPDVHLRIVRSADQLGSPDAVILPGSKNTLGDLAHLKASGLAARLGRLAEAGETEIVGICGGFQMLGREILDPDRIESDAPSEAGLGLLDVSTTLAGQKTLVRTEAVHVATGLAVRGYEIHHGRTGAGDGEAMFRTADGEVCGISSGEAMVWGTYMHGVFDADEFRRWWIDRLRARRGLAPLETPQAIYEIEPALDRLAAVVRDSIDVKRIYEAMGL